MANQAGRRARGLVEPVVFWERADGQIMLAPHTDLTPFPGYQKVECTTIREIEKWSKKMATQEDAKIRGMKVEEHLRSLPKWDEIIKRCNRKLENHECISPVDEQFTRNILASVIRKKDLLLRLMISPDAVSEGALHIEKHEAKVGMAQFQQKKVEV